MFFCLFVLSFFFFFLSFCLSFLLSFFLSFLLSWRLLVFLTLSHEEVHKIWPEAYLHKTYEALVSADGAYTLLFAFGGASAQMGFGSLKH